MLEYFQETVPRVSILRACDIDLREVMSREVVPKPVQAQLALAGWFDAAAADNRIRKVPSRGATLAFFGGLHSLAFTCFIRNTEGSDLSDSVDDLIHTIWAGLAPEDSQ